jgi:hypothetical protein
VAPTSAEVNRTDGPLLCTAAGKQGFRWVELEKAAEQGHGLYDGDPEGRNFCRVLSASGPLSDENHRNPGTESQRGPLSCPKDGWETEEWRLSFSGC